jgi:hypothetical protein
MPHMQRETRAVMASYAYGFPSDGAWLAPIFTDSPITRRGDRPPSKRCPEPHEPYNGGIAFLQRTAHAGRDSDPRRIGQGGSKGQ